MPERRDRRVGPPRVSFGNWVVGGSLLVNRREVVGPRPKSSAQKKLPAKKSPDLNPDSTVLPHSSSASEQKENEERTKKICPTCGGKDNDEPSTKPPEKPAEILGCNCNDKPVDNSARILSPKSDTVRAKPATKVAKEFKSADNPVKKPKKDDSKTDKPTNLSFTAEQDAELLKLKADNVSWKQIANQMSLAKKQVQKRFGELQNAKPKDSSAAEECVTAADVAAPVAPEEEVIDDWGGIGVGDNEYGNWNEIINDDWNKDKTSNDNGNGGSNKKGNDYGNGNDNWKDGGKNNDKSKIKANSNGNGNDGWKGHSNDSWNDVGNKNGKKNGSGRGSGGNSGEKGNDDNKSVNHNGGDKGNGGNANTGENRGNGTGHEYRSARGWYGTGRADMEMPKRRLLPDCHWSKTDCEILEMLETRYREQKWLTIQASFYNLTGRMVSGDIIEQKIRETL